MTVEELYIRLKREVDSGKGDYPIKIIVNNPGGMGARPSTDLKWASRGMDWESAQFNLVTEDKLFKLKPEHPLGKNPIELNNLSNPKNPE